MAGPAWFIFGRGTTNSIRSSKSMRLCIASRAWGNAIFPECCTNPLTGFYRTGSCETGPEDFGVHTVCAHVDAEFLAFSKAAGNDLSTPVPQVGFPGLKPGDCWCLCAARWREAFDAGKAPKVRLAATHEATLRIVPLDLLKK